MLLVAPVLRRILQRRRPLCFDGAFAVRMLATGVLGALVSAGAALGATSSGRCGGR